jgi:hypothetical protein
MGKNLANQMVHYSLVKMTNKMTRQMVHIMLIKNANVVITFALGSRLR